MKTALPFNKSFIYLVATFSLWGSVSIASSEVVTVPFVELKKYVGQWYEIASIPQSFQKKCFSNARAEYSMAEDRLIRVLNSCQTKSGGREVAEGRARIDDPATNAKLKVTFVKVIDWIFMFGGKYWIIDLANDYSYAVVGDPTRNYAWALSRTPALDIEILKGIEGALVQQGYDTSKILTSIQDGGIGSRVPLNQFIEK